MYSQFLRSVAFLALAASPATPRIAWAQSPSPAVAPAASPTIISAPAPTLDPESPMADLPDIGVTWPSIPGKELREDGTPEPDIAQSDEERRYQVVLDGLRLFESQKLVERFGTLSALKAGESKTANVAQVDRRAKEDAELLDQLLRAEGYYDASVEPRVEVTGRTLTVTMAIEPGPLYRFADVRVTGLDDAGKKAPALRDTFGVDVRDPVSADDVIAAESTLRSTIAREGFPFAQIGAPEVVVDHDTRTATLALTVTTGGEQRIGQFRVEGNKPPFGPKHVGVIARFGTGDPYDQRQVDDLKRAIIATGLVSSVAIEPLPGATPGTVDMAVRMEPAPMRTIAAEAGYGTGEGVRLSGSWTHRNLLPPEGAVTFSGIVGTREQAIGAVLRRGNFGDRDRVLNARVSASNINRKAFEARTFEIAANIERQTNIIWQKDWTWSAGFELLASDERDVVGGAARRRTFFIGALPATLAYDGTNDLLDPTTGFRLSARISPELSFQSGTFGYVRAQIDGSVYVPASDTLVIAARGRLGAISGVSLLRIAPSRRFYSGGGGSVRGFGFQNIGPRDAFNDPVGGRGLAEFALEARVRFGDFGVVPFIDAGNIYTGAIPTLKNFRFGTGIGVRYHSNFGPIRLDVGTPINRQPGDPRVAVYVSLGQAF
jgi:translocation and assembly module TamA